MPDFNYDITFEVAVPGVAVKTLTRLVTAPDIITAIEFAKEGLVIITVKGAVQRPLS